MKWPQLEIVSNIVHAMLQDADSCNISISVCPSEERIDLRQQVRNVVLKET